MSRPSICERMQSLACILKNHGDENATAQLMPCGLWLTGPFLARPPRGRDGSEHQSDVFDTLLHFALHLCTPHAQVCILHEQSTTRRSDSLSFRQSCPHRLLTAGSAYHVDLSPGLSSTCIVHACRPSYEIVHHQEDILRKSSLHGSPILVRPRDASVAQPTSYQVQSLLRPAYAAGARPSGTQEHDN